MDTPPLSLLRRILIAPFLAVIWLWQKARPLRPPMCRFYPSCSEYAATALRYHGPFKGGWLSVKRIAKCQPFHPGGFDPVPGAEHEHTSPALQTEGHPHAHHAHSTPQGD